jgi:branched-chain amino acid aminotransferase
VVIAVGSVQSSTSHWSVGDGTPGDITARLRDQLMGIQYGRVPDRHGWNHRISAVGS